MPDSPRLLAWCSAGVVCVALLAGCASSSGDDETSSGLGLPSLSDLNPFGIKKETLPGKRIAVLTGEDQLNSRLETATGSIAIPPPNQLAEWSTPGGAPSNAPGHLALNGSLRTLWSAEAGTGSTTAAKLTSAPIIHAGRVYVLDAANQLSAFSTGGGAKAWSVSVAPEGAKADKAFGGGIAAAGGRVFAVTGFGTILAFDAASGARLWEKSVGTPIHAAPTVADGRVFAVNTDGQVICLATGDGSVLWTYRGAPQQTAALIGNARPAVAGEAVIVPFTSGDLVALKVDSGVLLWTESLNGSKASSTIASLSDPASPVAIAGSVYAVSRSGRMIATNADTGARTWSMNLSGVETPWVAGDSIFVVDVTGRLVSLSRTTGDVRWASKLPGNAKVWNGPVLAGGKLWLTSSKGLLVGADPMTGQVAVQRDMGQPFYIAPAVADGRMYLLGDRAQVTALE